MNNGKKRQNDNAGDFVLGFTHLAPYTHYCHDSSVALLQQGRVIAAVAEERFTRIPHYAGYPACALNWLLQLTGTELKDIQTAALAWPDAPDNGDFSPHAEMRIICRFPKFKNISFVDHQRAHSFSAYAYAPFETGTILSLDGIGQDGNIVSAGAIYEFS